MNELLRRIRTLFRRDSFDADLDEEMRTHIEMQAEENRDNGMDLSEARYAAQRQFGNAVLLKEDSRGLWGWAWLERLAQDLRYAFRMIAKNPGFSATIVLTLALGMGATTAIFTVVNGVLIRPLPYQEPEELVAITSAVGNRSPSNTFASDFLSFRDHNRSLRQIAAYQFHSANFFLNGYSEHVQGGYATHEFFEMLGVQPILGRNFVPSEDTPGGPPAAILSYGFWQRHYSADKSVVGRSLNLNGKSHIIVGVLPRDFVAPGASREFQFSYWLPFAVEEGSARSARKLFPVIGRLKPGVTVQQAEADLNSLQVKKHHSGDRIRIVVANWQTQVTSDVRDSLFIFLGAVGFILLIACVNVANLLLGQAATREKEIALRCALGASRGRVLTQLLTESVLLSTLGAMAGIAVAYAMKGFLLAFLAPNLPSLEPIVIDQRVLFASLLVAVITGLLFGLVPALQSSKLNPQGGLQGSSRAGSEGRSQHRTRNLLVVAEVAVTVVLLCGAGLLARSFWRLYNLDAGYNPDNVLMMFVNLSGPNYQTPKAHGEYMRQALERISHRPGILSAGMASSPPLGYYSYALGDIALEGQEPRSNYVSLDTISADYFRTLGIDIIAGRAFSDADHTGAPSALIVNQAFARRFYHNGDCLGKRIRNWDNGSDWFTIVGVVRDVRGSLLWDVEPAVYTHYRQLVRDDPHGHVSLVVRTAGDPMLIAKAVQAELAAVDSSQPPYGITTLKEARRDYLKEREVRMELLAVFSFLALVLGVVGVYSVLAYNVRRRTHDIGVRVALGARPSQVVGDIVSSGLGLVVAGLGVGLLASPMLTRAIRSELWGVSPSDPWTLGAVATILIATGIAACLIPARRATRIDPMEALRHE